MNFKIFELDEDERAVGDFGETTYEDMYEAASRDVWRLLPIVEWVEKLDPKLIESAIFMLAANGCVDNAKSLRLWLEGKPK